MLEAHAGRVELPHFVLALLAGQVFVAPREDADEDTLALTVEEGPDGAQYVSVFTAPERLGRAGAASVRLGTLVESWPDDVAVVVNPGEALELVLPGADLRRIVSGDVGEPEEEPEEVLSAAAAACERHPEVAAGYRAVVGGRLAIGLLLDIPPMDPETLQRDIAEAAWSAGAGEIAIVLLGRDAGGDPVATHMLERTRPFYERG
jgi:SseB protein C-terminal domain/SseB protein N-terminal domain